MNVSLICVGCVSRTAVKRNIHPLSNTFANSQRKRTASEFILRLSLLKKTIQLVEHLKYFLARYLDYLEQESEWLKHFPACDLDYSEQESELK